MQGDVTIHDLKCVILVAQEGGLSRGATRLHMTQPALGRRIHHVEAELGARLFYSWYGGLRLTESGKVFIDEILKSVDNWERGTERERNVARHRHGPFQFAYSSFLNPPLLAVISNLHFDRPGDPVIKRTSLDTMGMIRGVLEGQYQAGIGYLPNGYSELEARELKKRSQREMGHLAQTRDLLVKQRSALKTKTTTCSRQRTSAQLMPSRGKAVRSRSIRSDSSAMDSGIYCNST